MGVPNNGATSSASNTLNQTSTLSAQANDIPAANNDDTNETTTPSEAQPSTYQPSSNANKQATSIATTKSDGSLQATLRRKELRDGAKLEYKRRTRHVRELKRNHDPMEVQKLIEENYYRGDKLYSMVKKKLEGTAADSRHMRELVNLCQESSKRINTGSKTFDMKRIIFNSIRNVDEDGRPLSREKFARYITEQHVNTFLLKPPTFEFFYGALRSEELEVKEKKKRAPRERIVETQAVTAKEKDMEVEVEQDSTPKEVEHISNEIIRLASDKPDGIPFFGVLVDPKSFTQTVENIFHASFLVKEGRVGVKRDSFENPIITVESGQSQEPAAGEGNQAILSFSLKDSYDWISIYNIQRRSFAAQDSGGGDNRGAAGYSRH